MRREEENTEELNLCAHVYVYDLDCASANGPLIGSVVGSVVGSVIVPAQIVSQLEFPLCACAKRDLCPAYRPGSVFGSPIASPKRTAP